ncbi:hypothetical protein I7I48_02876 [Histoplasma ohiense]|nr:hypothetical protein I7I48_02876 [Histoplasma ohiense (nom. inval.)]
MMEYSVVCSSRDQSVALLCYLMYCPRMCYFLSLYKTLFLFTLFSGHAIAWLVADRYILRSPLAAEVGFEENMSQW